ncbi:MAG: hypothetical protein GY717_06945 [Rhodobacteraceae bacterium]|nr:hypothetical protein [Paracoccaceae bacterium]
MAFTPATPPEAKTPGTGISAVLRVSKTLNTVRLFLSATAQAEHFGGSIIGRKLRVEIGSGEDEGRLLIALDERGAVAANPFLKKGGATLVLNAWGNLPGAPRPKGDCSISRSGGGEAVLCLPSWAVAEGKGGKLDASYVASTPPVPAARTRREAQPRRSVSSQAAAGREKARAAAMGRAAGS